MTKINQIRLEYGLTYNEMATETGIPKRTIESWCQGRRTPPPYMESLIKCALENGINLNDNDVENAVLIF